MHGSKRKLPIFHSEFLDLDSRSDITSRLYIYVSLKDYIKYHILILHKLKTEL